MIYPKFIKPGDTIGVTATSAGLDDEASLNKLNNAIKNMKNLGFNVIETNKREAALDLNLDGVIEYIDYIMLSKIWLMKF